MKVFPLPVALWMSALGRPSASDFSRFLTAVTSGPKSVGQKLRELLHPQPEAGGMVVEPMVGGQPDRLCREPVGHCLGLVEMEDPATAAVRIQSIGKSGFDPGALVEKWQGLHRDRNADWNPL